MMHCKYTKEWQSYDMDYDKWEVDIRLIDGTIVENCYPNAGVFTSFSEEHEGQQFKEELVGDIRLSHKEVLDINFGV